MFRTAIEAEILFAAHIMHLRFLERLSGKTPREQNSSGKKIGAVWCSGADRRSFEASAVLHFVFFEVIVNKMQQSAKRIGSNKNNKSSLPEVFPLTIGSGKTMPFEKRHAGCEEREKINRRRIFDTLRINFFESTKQTACIFSKGDGNMTKKMSTTKLPGGRGNAYPNADLDYELTYEYDPAYAHRLVHAGNRYYRYDANGNITAEKDGPFTEEDEFVFTYNYDPDSDVYSADYGFGLDAPKETEDTSPQNIAAYRRNYTWNEKNLLTKSSDRSYTVHYRYGEDGQRALKYTEEGRSETLYFNNFYTIHIPVQDKNNPQGLRVHKHIFVGNSRLVTAMTHTDNNGDNAEQREKRYYYHSDHLGSAQFVTDWRGKQYEHIEYTPYGELWIEEVAAGLDKLPFRFTGKEMDEETGLYYYGARYLDPKYSRWLSGDPALGEYMSGSSVGAGGIYNTVNFNVYHYGNNNPIKYTDPTGMWIDNGDGTYTAEKGDTLWDKYGADWKEKSGFTRDPRILQSGETVGQQQQHEYQMPLDPISPSYNDNSEGKSFFSNHEAFTSYRSKNGADALYAGVGANFDYKNGNFNLNAKTGIAAYEGAWKANDSKKFNFGLTGRVSGVGGDVMVGLEGSLFGISVDAHVFKGGGSVDITLRGLTVSIGGDVMAGGIGGSLLLGKNGFKAALDFGVGAGLQVTWKEEKE